MINTAEAWRAWTGGEPETLMTTSDGGTQLVTAMATGAQAKFQSDVGLAVGPCPPTPAPGADPPRIAIALATPQNVITHSTIYVSHPDLQQERAAKEALNFTRLWLLEHHSLLG